MKHKRKDFTLKELIGDMKVEVENRMHGKSKIPHSSLNVNLVESTTKFDRIKNKGQTSKGWPKHKLALKTTKFKKAGAPEVVDAKASGVCFNCDKPGHIAKFCRAPRRYQPKDQKAQVNLTEGDTIVAVISEVNLVSNVVEWIVDTGATRHICTNKDMFAEYQRTSEGELVFMGNSSAVKVHGKGKILLKLNSGR